MRGRRGASVVGVAAIAIVLAGCGDGSTDQSGGVVPPAAAASTVSTASLGPDPQIATTAPRGSDPTVAPGSSVVVFPAEPVPTVMVGDPGSPPVTIDDDYLAGVPAVSVPMAISEHLSQVQLAVRSIVGNDVFAGAAFTDDTGESGLMTIYGTDVDAIEAALDRIGTDQRDRITVVASDYSFADLRDVAAQAEAALHANGLAPVWIRALHDGSGVDVAIERTEGRSDDELIAAATTALAGLPVFVTVSDPPVPD